MKVLSLCQIVGSLLAVGTNKLMIGSPEIVKKLILLIHVLFLKEQLAGQRIHLEENVEFFFFVIEKLGRSSGYCTRNWESTSYI